MAWRSIESFSFFDGPIRSKTPRAFTFDDGKGADFNVHGYLVKDKSVRARPGKPARLSRPIDPGKSEE